MFESFKGFRITNKIIAIEYVLKLKGSQWLVQEVIDMKIRS